MNNHFAKSGIISSDWCGETIIPAASFQIINVADQLVFSASRPASASILPQARPNEFTPELWRYDVAELFLLDPSSGHYLELNLAPNGAWWACWFTSPRTPKFRQPSFADFVPSHNTNANSWQASLTIPLHQLPPLDTARYNVTFILDSPEQRFLTAFPLGQGEPDFHRPQHFQPLDNPT